MWFISGARELTAEILGNINYSYDILIYSVVSSLLFFFFQIEKYVTGKGTSQMWATLVAAVLTEDLIMGNQISIQSPLNIHLQ